MRITIANADYVRAQIISKVGFCPFFNFQKIPKNSKKILKIILENHDTLLQAGGRGRPRVKIKILQINGPARHGREKVPGRVEALSTDQPDAHCRQECL